jgi:hypothetical protein
MLRTIAISLILLLSVGVMLPFSNSAHGVRQSTQVGRRSARYHSRAWWRRYRARMRKKRAAALELAHRKAMLSQLQNIPVNEMTISNLPMLTNNPTVSNVPLSTEAPVMTASVSAVPTSTEKASEVESSTQNMSSVKTASANASDAKQPLKSVSAKLPGQMNISVVALSRPNPVFLTAREESKMLAGTPVADLRRIVIEKMVVAGGWVINDFVREINGSRVFVVTARTPREANSPEKAWAFYFTEADGRIYGLATDAPLDSAERMSNEAERFINKLVISSQTNNR